MNALRPLTPLQALEKARRWCALQERCHTEVHTKLCSWGLTHDEANQIAAQLISEGFLNEERFARAFSRGKFRMKQWGRNKIVHELKKKKVTPYCIHKGLEEIDDDEYMQMLRKLLLKRRQEVKERNPWKRKAKIVSFLVAKGYETELIKDVLSDSEE